MRAMLRLIVLLAAGVLSGSMVVAQVYPLNPDAQQPPQPGRVQRPASSQMDSAGAPGESPQQIKDKMFLRSVVASNLAQVQFAQLAASNSSSAEIRELSQRLADQRTRLNASMEQVADSIGVRLPKSLNKNDRVTFDRLKSLSGQAFDKEYLTCVVRDHHDDLRDFRVEMLTTSDTDLRDAVGQGARMLHENLGVVRRLAEENGVAVPQHGPPRDPAQPSEDKPANPNP